MVLINRLFSDKQLIVPDWFPYGYRNKKANEDMAFKFPEILIWNPWYDIQSHLLYF